MKQIKEFKRKRSLKNKKIKLKSLFLYINENKNLFFFLFKPFQEHAKSSFIPPVDLDLIRFNLARAFEFNLRIHYFNKLKSKMEFKFKSSS